MTQPIAPGHPEYARCVEYMRRFGRIGITIYLGKDIHGTVISAGIYRIWRVGA